MYYKIYVFTDDDCDEVISEPTLDKALVAVYDDILWDEVDREHTTEVIIRRVGRTETGHIIEVDIAAFHPQP